MMLRGRITGGEREGSMGFGEEETWDQRRKRG